jgi:hypothetical protein
MWYGLFVQINIEKRSRRAARGLKQEGIEPEYRHKWHYVHGGKYEMPIEKSSPKLVEDAEEAVKYAQTARNLHARKSKRGTPQREADIKAALDKLKKAMKPIRRRIARLPYMNDESAAGELRKASQDIQRERRKLWKLRGSKNA